MVLIDDATNRTYARLYEAEDTRAAFDVFGRYTTSMAYRRRCTRIGTASTKSTRPQWRPRRRRH